MNIMSFFYIWGVGYQNRVKRLCVYCIYICICVYMYLYIYIYIGGLMEYISKKVAAYGQCVLVFYKSSKSNKKRDAFKTHIQQAYKKEKLVNFHYSAYLLNLFMRSTFISIYWFFLSRLPIQQFFFTSTTCIHFSFS